MNCSLNTPLQKQANKYLGNVLVLGLGKSGKAAVEYLAAQPQERIGSITVYAGQASQDSKVFASAHASSAQFIFDEQRVIGSYDLCIASPGISQLSEFYITAANSSVELVSEIEFAWRESSFNSVWIAVTGTNGKTTVTSLITHILKESGYDAQSVGNIGDVALSAVQYHPSQYYVAEVSSYQLASVRDFAPQVAILLNITPDHLTWHGSMDAYIQAKYKILSHLKNVPGAVAILDATNDIVRSKVRELKGQKSEQRGFEYIPIGTTSGLSESMIDRCGAACAAWLNGDLLQIDAGNDSHVFCAASELQIQGLHNVSNALAAAAAALSVGVKDSQITSALKSFAPLEHRIEPCGEICGVKFFNDSKATNVDSTLIALNAFARKSVIVLLGGRDKLTPLDELVALCNTNAKAVVLFGESLDRFKEAFADSSESLQVLCAHHLADALVTAYKLSAPGDNILLSPACASFDEFSCFEERGDVFKQLVRKLAGRE